MTGDTYTTKVSARIFFESIRKAKCKGLLEVKPDKHSEEVLAALTALQGARPQSSRVISPSRLIILIDRQRGCHGRLRGPVRQCALS